MTSATQSQDGARDFDFLLGRWHIVNRRLVARLQNSQDWETFEASNNAWLLPGGIGNIDEYRSEHWPDFVGMTLRIHDPASRKWSLYWVDNKGNALQPPVVGSFSKGVGVFEGSDVLRGQPVRVRFTWTVIDHYSARWEQAFSPDNGQTWETNWTMAFSRDS